MNIASLLLLILVLWLVVRGRSQARRIRLLAENLSGLQIEQHMQTLTTGYLRAIHEPDLARQEQIWPTFAATERALAAQTEHLARALARVPAEQTRMGRLALDFPCIESWVPGTTRDFRALLKLHAEGIRQAVDNVQNLGPKDRAYCLMAEWLLFQHSCHWFCKSRNTADARLVLRHQVTREKALDSVSPSTRQAYQRWMET
ncbi:hypothetical protein EBQ26_07750 [Allofranklinella schreckenbergeri]|uniref:Uncharacterized protein n=1 Tax=Allofranklinella schreckenbergeri TaxID=1076744 RepID=A0A3M6Q3W8_9BURK|nr:hypothetical protein [Allofranklinella schreckenbergeri]RMW97902.1 hypothetical protein EBQ26_07750 [Allofranklinella schreckenbergeri]